MLELSLYRYAFYHFLADCYANAPSVANQKSRIQMLAQFSALITPAVSTETGYNFFVSAHLNNLQITLINSDLPALCEDYFQLFVGVAGSVVNPYYSWYRCGHLFDYPLRDCRDDLTRLGVGKNSGNPHSEDHLGNLLSSQAILIEQTDFDEQTTFFQRYLGSWFSQCTLDIIEHANTALYLQLAQLTQQFLQSECQLYKATAVASTVVKPATKYSDGLDAFTH